ncbi:testis-expressed protein 48 [Eulemur rufifrons]|uniref:testis-expressed protein 48 n=1 Tax=Eulemur rufifrons TaxID=859984 RepID=UPI0037446BE5
MATIPLPPTAANQSVAWKIFCLCCRECEESCVISNCNDPNQIQEHQPSAHGRYLIRTHCVAFLDFSLFIPPLLRYLQTSSSPPDPAEFSLPDMQLQKNGPGGQNPKHAKATSCLPSEKSLIHPKQTASFTSSDFEDLYTRASQRNFYKRNLDRYSQERWPFQTCFIGRP